ncbi:L-ornithine N5-oxygenase [Saccharopolyspora erythraea NRRL 2338]|uniref:L-lysine N6-monooxygenase MbtG n=2 Tax=Saccharopolyspora erythraea TaxID=1836 RepID=A4FE36_SACEN|nr:lysine N(6)-hydroxylase/L-ornithine N(5)-oxygenase family protein [Saccharopolyspora erythraea]PFG96038.1 L-ornithine N5-oxygenase [Saccharopolyspora erythraea NRRL 2338]CAM02311.1 putative peptide monooxygenase [Saccharopolyspora erythraea NRRL 2338]
MTRYDDSNPVRDLVGVGFGPSNLALAIAVREHNAQVGAGDQVDARFLESKPAFGWHRGMLIDDATMQVSFLKDLVTQRNPASEFSFLSYLHSKGRLVDFINHKSLFPLRVEFHDYFEWAASHLDDSVDYGVEVVGVEPVVRDGVVEHFDVVGRTASGQEMTYPARNVVLATGLEPNLPEGITSGDRVWHNSELLHRIESLPQRGDERFVVVGAGQSAAEVVAHLHGRFQDAQVSAVFSRYGYSPSDDSPFANRIFDPSAVDDFYTAPEQVKQKLLGYHANTNYSVVDLDLINDLYRRVYQEKVLGRERLRVLNTSRVLEVVETDTGVRVAVESLTTGEKALLESDVVVYATGYRPSDPTALLGELAEHCERDDQGRYRVARDYRLMTGSAVRGGIYLQGGTEHTHGITSSLLSNTAVRGGEILRSIVDDRGTGMPRLRVAQ